jgi:hypothetical protein
MPRELIVSPRGEAQWAKVLGEAAEGYEEGSPRAWSVSLLLDPSDPETIEFIERLEAEFEKLHGKANKISSNGWPFGDETSKDEKGRPVPTGKVKFNFKRKEVTARGDLKAGPVVVDSKKNRWPVEKLIGNGSKIKVAFSPWGWSNPSGKGMSLELEQIQVLELVEYAKESSVLFEEEEGYVLAPVEEEPGLAAAEEQPQSLAARFKAKAAQADDELAPDQVPF